MSDPIDGTPGNDPVLAGTSGDDVIRGFAGNDGLYGGYGIDQLFGGDDNDTLMGDNGVDSLFGGDGDDRLQGVGNAVLLSTGGPSDVLDGGDGIDIMVVSYLGFYGSDGIPPPIQVDIRIGQGEVIVGGFRGENFTSIERLEFAGSEAGDRATGGRYADVLAGHGGDDILRGGDGDDVVRDTWGRIDADGGAGIDRFELRLDIFGHDNLGGTVIDGNAGSITVAGVGWGQFLRFESLTVQLGRGADTVIGMSNGANVINAGYATLGNKTITGGNLGDQLSGGQENDTITGGGGNDSITGWGGANSLYGGAGNDSITIVGGADRIVAGQGNDTVNGGGFGCDVDLGVGNDVMYLYEPATVSAETYRGGTGTDIFRIYYQAAALDFSNVTLTGFEVLEFVDYGHALNLRMTLTTTQLAQFQRLVYGSIGGDNDSFVIALADNADVVLPAATQLTGLVLAEGGQLADLRQVDSDHIPWVTGGSGGDRVLGPAAAALFRADLGGGRDRFDGLGAADQVTGGGGNDRLSGGAGRDSLAGNAGRDVLLGGAGSDLLNGGAGGDRLFGGAGADVIRYGAASESTGLAHDELGGFDFGADVFDLDVTVSAIGAEVAGRLRQGSFDADLELAVDGGRLEAGQALLFQATAGDRAGDRFLIVDWNGEDGYQAGEDLLVWLVDPARTEAIALGNFI